MNKRAVATVAIVEAVASMVALLTVLSARSADGLETAITYQGQVMQSGAPVNDTCDLQFSLYDAVSGGSQLGAMQTVSPVLITDGLFTVMLNDRGQFGAGVFNGSDRWLQVAVRCPVGVGNYLTLVPRQQLTATPYALYSPVAGGVNCTGCVDSTALAAGAVTGSNIASGTIQQSHLAFAPATVTSVATGAGLIGGPITTSGTLSVVFGTTPGTVAAGETTWNLTGNAGTTAGTNFFGTTDNQPLELRVNGIRALSLQPTDSHSGPNVLAGFSGNGVNPGVKGATIGGGGGNSPREIGPNRVASDFGTVGGGAFNFAGGLSGDPAVGRFATVGGGVNNQSRAESATVGGGNHNWANSDYATVGGGFFSTAGADYATVGGGTSNHASGLKSTVAGGNTNVASVEGATIGGGTSNQSTGVNATVPGGASNIAGGQTSFAAGCGAQAQADGAFVWVDSNCDLGPVTTKNQFYVRASGGVVFLTNAHGVPGTGASLAAGSSAWSSVSDRNAKENAAAVDGRDVLARLATVSIQTWNWRSQDSSVRHIGPMAQDFYATFNVGEDDRHISTVDADGVALAAIQGLHAVVQEKEAEISRQAQQIAGLETRLAALERTVTMKDSAAPPRLAAVAPPWLALCGLLVVGFVLGQRCSGSR